LTFTTQICIASELGETELELWRSWQRADVQLACPYITPELAIAQARRNPRLRVAVLSDGNNIVGFLPFEQKTRNVAHVRAMISDSSLEWNAQELMKSLGVSVFEFDYLLGHQIEQFSPHWVQREAAPVADLSEGWDAWLAKKNKESSQLKSFSRKLRKLDREVGALEFELQSGSHEDLEQMMEWKSGQLVLTGRVDRFADPSYRALFHDLLDSPSEHFAIHLSRLKAGDRVVGVHLTATSQHIASVWHTAYDPDPELDKYSCGMGLMMKHMEVASSKGITKIEYGRGAARYKELFKDYDEYVAEGWSERPTPAAYIRRAQLAPKRIAYRVVLGNPRLRVAARHTLARIGDVRSRLK
jgi:CelD/BcsL family acetyltransferase involved in cellulose biosynthesis